MIGRETDNGTSQNQKPTASRTKPRLLRQQGATRCTLGMDLKKRSQKIHGMPIWNHPPHHVRIPDHENLTTANET